MTEGEIDEVVAVDIRGDYGHFRKNYTTSSPLTHGIPPRTALTGLLGAIMGYPRRGDGNYHEVFAPTRAKIAVVPRAPIRKQRINKNMLKVKGGTANLIGLGDPPEQLTRNQVPFEFLRNPHYTLYIWHADEERFASIEDQLAAHKSVYTPSLGLSELLAEFEYRGRFDLEAVGEKGHVDSVVNADQYSIEFERGKQYHRENISLVMDEDRVVQSFADVMYAERESGAEADSEAGPCPLRVAGGRQYRLPYNAAEGDRIAFLTG